MNTTHNPDPQFVDNLERELRLTVRRRERFDNGSAVRASVIRKYRWATVVVALAAMCVGSAATFAVTQRVRAQMAELIIAKWEAHLEFASARVEFFRETMQRNESLAADGMLTPGEIDAMRLELTHVEADAAARGLDVEEARISGRDPDNSLSAPVLRGRDFVTERLELQRPMFEQHIALLDKQASRHGLDPNELSMITQQREAAQAALSEVESRIALRQDYLSGTRTAREVELAHMKSAIEPQREIAARRVDELQQQLDRYHALAEDGMASRQDVLAVEMEFRAAVLHRDLAELEMRILESKLADSPD
jgi:multidrug resistance efflux pump